MSNYCSGCSCKPEQRSGAQACPETVLSWHCLDRHERRLAAKPRTVMMAKNIQRLLAERRANIRMQAAAMLDNLDSL